MYEKVQGEHARGQPSEQWTPLRMRGCGSAPMWKPGFDFWQHRGSGGGSGLRKQGFPDFPKYTYLGAGNTDAKARLPERPVVARRSCQKEAIYSIDTSTMQCHRNGEVRKLGTLLQAGASSFPTAINGLTAVAYHTGCQCVHHHISIGTDLRSL